MGVPQIHTPYKRSEKLLVTYFRACVDGGTDIKPFGLVEQHTIQKVRFTSAVHARDRNDTNGSF